MVPYKSFVKVLASLETPCVSVKVGLAKSCRSFAVWTPGVANRDFLSTVLVRVIYGVAFLVIFISIGTLVGCRGNWAYLALLKWILGVLLWSRLYEALDRHESSLFATVMTINRIFEFFRDDRLLTLILRTTLASCDGQVFDHNVVGWTVFDHATAPVVEGGRATALRLLMNLLLLDLHLPLLFRWLLHVADEGGSILERLGEVVDEWDLATGLNHGAKHAVSVRALAIEGVVEDARPLLPATEATRENAESMLLSLH